MNPTLTFKEAKKLADIFPNIVTVECSFNLEDPHYGKKYFYLGFKRDLEPDKDAIVEAREGTQVAHVTAVHDSVKPSSAPYMRWCLGHKGTEAPKTQETIRGLLSAL